MGFEIKDIVSILALVASLFALYISRRNYGLSLEVSSYNRRAKNAEMKNLVLSKLLEMAERLENVEARRQELRAAAKDDNDFDLYDTATQADPSRVKARVGEIRSMVESAEDGLSVYSKSFHRIEALMPEVISIEAELKKKLDNHKERRSLLQSEVAASDKS